MCFEKSFFNKQDEFIAHEYSNTYFIFSDCKTELDVKCKILEWFSRPASKGMPYSSEWRNKKFRKVMLEGVNQFLGTVFLENDMEVIYEHLGNAINHEKTIRFVESGFDFSVLESKG